MEDENKESKRTSKLTSLINQEEDNFSNLQITVYYSENNWETCEEVNLILEDTTTINQLIDASVYKFKTELYYDNMDKKQFKVMLFKKKTKKPNFEYPICNPESNVKDYGKNHFCLVEDINTKNEFINAKKEESIKEIEDQSKRININNQEKEKNKEKENNENKNEIKEINDEKEKKGYKICGGKCIGCYFF